MNARKVFSAKLSRKVAIWGGALVIFASGLAVGTLRSNPVSAQRGNPGDSAAFDTFWRVWDIVHTDYVDIEKFDDKVLIEGAMAGMVGALGDPNSAYMSPALYAQINDSQNGLYEGVGASVRKDSSTGGLEIVATTKDTPARELLKVGDIIVFVNGEDITKLTETQIIGKVRGPAGTTVILGILREGERAVLTIVDLCI